MRSLGFLLSRRWALFAVAIGVVAYGTWWLGEWQFSRLEDRKSDNAVIRANEGRPPAPVAEVLAPGEPVADDEEWRVVSATGRYSPDDTVIVRYRTRDSASGVDVVVPLVTADGTALLVDRGWMATDNRGSDVADVPEPPAGEVTVTGYVRADGTGSSTAVSDQSTRAVNSDAIGDALGLEVFTGWVELRSEDPPPAEALEPVELPELDNGPHFFYGLQWWFFGVLALGGFGYLIWDEWRRTTGRKTARGQRPRDGAGTGSDSGQSARSMPPSTGSITPVTNDAAGESRNAAARPNSSGSP